MCFTKLLTLHGCWGCFILALEKVVMFPVLSDPLFLCCLFCSGRNIDLIQDEWYVRTDLAEKYLTWICDLLDHLSGPGQHQCWYKEGTKSIEPDEEPHCPLSCLWVAKSKVHFISCVFSKVAWLVPLQRAGGAQAWLIWSEEWVKKRQGFSSLGCHASSWLRYTRGVPGSAVTKQDLLMMLITMFTKCLVHSESEANLSQSAVILS